ncbi:putative disease resistance RPP8-like protein 2 [Acorus gramineus]|uniref:Disease resistance RPP8-like protein 2 n=1 Tax=Acorus gramineus TaxID=55184 RepID=A0AAV9BUH0_ACOGR|nr:putative disease resistance RPP8-like protein 2 [Acorus gramineus]
MERELQRMQAFFEYADEHLEFKSDPRTRIYVNQMREIAFEGEDVVEEFMVKEQRKKRKLSEGILSGFRKRYACIFCTLKDRHDIGTEIEKINKKINEITNSLKTYGTNNFSISEASTNQGMKQWSRPQPLLPPDEKDIIGLDDQANDIMVQLEGQDGRQRVLPIIGMGGLGKTTLARKVYNRVKASMDFQCLAWITVSKGYNQKELLQLMVKEIMGHGAAKELFDKMLSKGDLAIAISEFLMKKKYFIVLDDIWNDKFWETFNVFPDSKNGSSLMITTRFENVAMSFGANNPPFKMKFLGIEECLELLVKKAGLDVGKGFPIDLNEPAKQIVERCGHLPLSLAVIGGILSTRIHTASEWWNVARKIKWELSNRPQDCIEILRLSYDDLPTHLKSCFLYFGLFPEDYLIDAKTIIRLWVAEGFIQPTEENTVEEVASEYLKDLVSRSMIQMVAEDYIGGVETCHIHDLMHELSVNRAKETKFLSTKPSVGARRLKVSEFADNENDDIVEDKLIFRNLRALFAFKPDSQQLKNLCDGSPRVKVLYCTGCNIHVQEIGRKYHLRYLDVQHSGGVDLQNVRHLFNLQTLSVEFDRDLSKEIEIDLLQLRNLRHVILHSRYVYRISLYGLEGAKDLQTLIGVDAGDWIESVLPKLIKLRTLKIQNCKESHSKALEVSLVQLKHLVTLHLEGEGGFPGLYILSGLVHLLEVRVKLNQIMTVVPKGQVQMINLNKLIFIGCEPKHYPIEMLAKLPSLRYLHVEEFIYERCCSVEWHMKQGDFPHLQVLILDFVRRVRSWIVDDGALPHLQRLTIYNNYGLNMLPDGLRHINTLRQLELIYPGVLRRRAEKDTGADWDKIKHIPMIM